MTSKCIITVKDEVWCVVSGLNPEHQTFLWNAFGVHPDGYIFMNAYKMRRWDGFIRFYEKTGKTYIRLLDKILPYIEKWGYEFELVDNRTAQTASPSLSCKTLSVDSDGIAIEAEGRDFFGDVKLPDGKQILLRPYQVQCLEKMIEAGSGFCISSTGSGKSILTAALSKTYVDAGIKTITIVPSDDLVSQTYDWYKLCELDVGRYSGTNKELEHWHIVATWQALQYNPSILEDFGCIIWDEAHGCRGKTAQELLNKYAHNAMYRFGVTGTFPKSECDQMSLHVSVGPIICEVNASWLMKNGYLAKVEIQPIELNEAYVEEEFPDYDSERAFLSKSPRRMEKIADIIISECATHGNTLVLVNSIPFGKKLASLIKDSVFLYGESSSDIRKENYDMFDQRDDLIVIASVGIASTGISINRIFCLAMVDPGKSFVRCIQSVGRSLRMAKDKDSVHVVDIHSKLKWARKHFRDRAKFYKQAEYPVLPKQTLKIKSE